MCLRADGELCCKDAQSGKEGKSHTRSEVSLAQVFEDRPNKSAPPPLPPQAPLPPQPLHSLVRELGPVSDAARHPLPEPSSLRKWKR